MRILLVIIALALASCGTIPAAKPVCLPLKDYTSAEQQRLAAEIAALPPGAALIEAMADYGAMRAADRACMGVSK